LKRQFGLNKEKENNRIPLLNYYHNTFLCNALHTANIRLCIFLFENIFKKAPFNYDCSIQNSLFWQMAMGRYAMDEHIIFDFHCAYTKMYEYLVLINSDYAIKK
jgi:hypothetical protein